jgi:hypothetical protein
MLGQILTFGLGEILQLLLAHRFIWSEAPFSLDFFISPRFAAKAALAAFCCAFDFASMIEPPDAFWAKMPKA